MREYYGGLVYSAAYGPGNVLYGFNTDHNIKTDIVIFRDGAVVTVKVLDNTSIAEGTGTAKDWGKYKGSTGDVELTTNPHRVKGGITLHTTEEILDTISKINAMLIQKNGRTIAQIEAQTGEKLGPYIKGIKGIDMDAFEQAAGVLNVEIPAIAAIDEIMAIFNSKPV